MNANAADRKALFKADWTQFIFVHFTIPPIALSAHTPLRLACRDGLAYVSLVFFRFDRMRPAVLPERLGAFLGRPASDNWFLNVRTYVRGPAGPGIQFLVEWMDNPISRRLGPLLYGLPYRLGRFDRSKPEEGQPVELRVEDVDTGASLRLNVTRGTEPAHPAAPGSMEAFVLDHYTAYTHRKGVTRYFKIDHPEWTVSDGRLEGMEGDLLATPCPWFRHATFHSVQFAEGFRDISMGAPHRAPPEGASHPAPFRRPATAILDF